jgi:hypothetical protein
MLGVMATPAHALFFVAAVPCQRGRLDMLEIPLVVRRVGFPILVAIGRLLGKYRRFADAPPAVTRGGPSARAGR